MLPVTRYNPGTYPPSKQYMEFDDMAGEIHSKLSQKRRGMIPFHMERLHHGRVVPLKTPSHEMEMQTENPTANADVQTEAPFVPPRDRQRDHPDDEEHDIGGGQGGGGGPMEMARRAARGAQTGARHFKPLANVAGAVAGSLAVAGGYAAGAIGSMGLYGLTSAGGVIGSAMAGGEASDAEGPPTPSPLDPASSSGATGSGAVPAYLLDRGTEEYKANAKKPKISGKFIQQEQDRPRIKKQETADQRKARRQEAEAVIQRHLGPV